MSTQEASGPPLDDVRNAVARARAHAADLPDPIARVERLTALSGLLADLGQEVGSDRTEALPEALEQADSAADLARRVHVTPQRLGAMLDGLRRDGKLPSGRSSGARKQPPR